MLTLEKAKERLKDCIRAELRDHAFGDREVTWFVVQNGLVVAEAADGYFGGGTSGISVYEVPIPYEKPWDFSTESGSLAVDLPEEAYASTGFDGREAYALLECGRLEVERNDSTGTDTYQEGACMPGLTLEGVRKELCGEEG
jgi:hypothetical protein